VIEVVVLVVSGEWSGAGVVVVAEVVIVVVVVDVWDFAN
jgi:hypothetical protein